MSGKNNERRIVPVDNSNPIASKNEDYFEKSFILSDNAGTGKTVFLKKLVQEARYVKSSKWVLYIDLAHCNDAIKRLPSIVDLDAFISFLHDVESLNLNSELAKNSIKHIISNENRGNLAIAFDNFNEIKDVYGETAGKYKKNLTFLLKFLQEIKVTVWISTRPYDLKFIRSNFNALAFELMPVSQRGYENFQKIVRSVFTVIFNQRTKAEFF